MQDISGSPLSVLSNSATEDGKQHGRSVTLLPTTAQSVDLRQGENDESIVGVLDASLADGRSDRT